MCNLGVLYATGSGVRKNPGIAKRLYSKAAALGDHKAQVNLLNLTQNLD